MTMDRLLGLWTSGAHGEMDRGVPANSFARGRRLMHHDDPLPGRTPWSAGSKEELRPLHRRVGTGPRQSDQSRDAARRVRVRARDAHRRLVVPRHDRAGLGRLTDGLFPGAVRAARTGRHEIQCVGAHDGVDPGSTESDQIGHVATGVRRGLRRRGRDDSR